MTPPDTGPGRRPDVRGAEDGPTELLPPDATAPLAAVDVPDLDLRDHPRTGAAADPGADDDVRDIREARDARGQGDPAALIAALARNGGGPGSDGSGTTPTGDAARLTRPTIAPSAPSAHATPTTPPQATTERDADPTTGPTTGPAGRTAEPVAPQAFPPPPPGQVGRPLQVRDALPYPEPHRRGPLAMIGLGAGIGLLVLALVGIVALGLRERNDTATTDSRPRPSPTAIAGADISVTASSTQESEGGISYSAENTLDGRPETAWNSDGRKDGKGPGMSVTYGFGDPVDLASITVLNGYQKTLTSSGRTQDLFDLNSRVHMMRVVTDDATFTWELSDDRTAQTLTKDFGTISSVRFEILSVHPGSKYLDLALSEVSFAAYPAAG